MKFAQSMTGLGNVPLVRGHRRGGVSGWAGRARRAVVGRGRISPVGRRARS